MDENKKIANDAAARIWTEVLKARGDYAGWFEDQQAAATIINSVLDAAEKQGMEKALNAVQDALRKMLSESHSLEKVTVEEWQGLWRCQATGRLVPSRTHYKNDNEFCSCNPIPHDRRHSYRGK